MSDCTKCFRYRSKEREIDALRHELALLEGYNKALRDYGSRPTQGRLRDDSAC